MRYEMRSIIVRTDRDRASGPFDRLIVLLQREMGARLVRIPCSVRKGSRGLSRIALSINSRLFWNSPKRLITEAHVAIGVHDARIQVERALVLGDRFVEAKLGLECDSSNAGERRA